jgi:hypothetical protein
MPSAMPWLRHEPPREAAKSATTARAATAVQIAATKQISKFDLGWRLRG